MNCWKGVMTQSCNYLYLSKYGTYLRFALCSKRDEKTFFKTYITDGQLAKYQDEMTAISELASKEFQIERSIRSMQADWEEVRLEVKRYKDSNWYCIVCFSALF
jgi:hypothetical protein